MAKSKILKIFATHKYVELPQPAVKNTPEWYKKIPSFYNKEKHPRIITGDETNLTVKKCMPFFDTFRTGYVATLWQDLEISVESEHENPILKWRTDPPVADGRGPNPHSSFPVPAGCSDFEFIWDSPFIFESSPNYDLLITHPLNRYDLPFITLSGIVSGENFGTGNIPFYIKKGFSGIIKKGTPIFQIIPIKREPWISKASPELLEKELKNRHESLTFISDWYKKRFWKPKDYR